MTFRDLLAGARVRFRSENGQTMAEYGVVVSVITLSIIVAIAALSGGISHVIDSVTTLFG
ncbi:MAG: Flp family type IVb pilin [Gaiellaceae bacterium]